jgi:putative hemolysin
MITVRTCSRPITGEFRTEVGPTSWAVQRDDGSWLFDGLIPRPRAEGPARA